MSLWGILTDTDSVSKKAARIELLKSKIYQELYNVYVEGKQSECKPGSRPNNGKIAYIPVEKDDHKFVKELYKFYDREGISVEFQKEYDDWYYCWSYWIIAKLISY